jgi:hypothetical protein
MKLETYSYIKLHYSSINDHITSFLTYISSTALNQI